MKKVPFFPNTKDDLHCYQASLRMILKYFLPQKSYTYKALDGMTNQKKGYWTWQMRGMLTLRSLGFDVVDIEIFDFQQFANNPKKYLLEYYGPEVGAEQIEHSDVEGEKENALEFIQKINVVKKIPTLSEVRDYVNKGYLVCCLINASSLNRKKGYIGHFVVIFRVNDHHLWLHDPGLPPRKNRRVTARVFEEAWACPDETAKNIFAFKLL